MRRITAIVDDVERRIAMAQLLIVNRWPLIKPTLINLIFCLSFPIVAAHIGGKTRTWTLLILAASWGVFSYQRGVADTVEFINRMHGTNAPSPPLSPRKDRH